MNRDRRLLVASRILCVAAIGLAAASSAILSPFPDLTSKTGRHLLAGALANLSLSVVMLLVAAIPFRRGERWSFVAYAIPLLLYGLPVLLTDLMNVAPERLLPTLAPQVIGLVFALVGLFVGAGSIFGPATQPTSRGKP